MGGSLGQYLKGPLIVTAQDKLPVAPYESFYYIFDFVDTYIVSYFKSIPYTANDSLCLAGHLPVPYVGQPALTS